jgi:hypothetical protein
MATVAVVTLSPLTEFDMGSKTISSYLQVTFAAGVYQTGGIHFGLVDYADRVTIDASAFLQAVVLGEAVDNTSGPVGGYTYRYCPADDVLQIFTRSTGLELAAAALPAGVTNDTVICKATWNRV